MIIEIASISAVAIIATIATAAVKKNGKAKTPDIILGTGGKTEDQVKQLIRDGYKKVGSIFKASEKINNEEFSEKIQRICISARNIYDDLEKHPNDIQRAGSFLNYYIDTTVKIVNKYVEFTEHKDLLPDVDKSLVKFENVIDSIEENFNKQFAKLYQDDIFDFDVEIQHLEKMLKMEAL